MSSAPGSVKFKIFWSRLIKVFDFDFDLDKELANFYLSE